MAAEGTKCLSLGLASSGVPIPRVSLAELVPCEELTASEARKSAYVQGEFLVF